MIMRDDRSEWFDLLLFSAPFFVCLFLFCIFFGVLSFLSKFREEAELKPTWNSANLRRRVRRETVLAVAVSARV